MLEEELTWLCIVCIVAVAISFYVRYIIAGLFEDVANNKGASSHEQTMAWRLCFWLGTVGYIYVAALPNYKAVLNTTGKAEQNPSTSPSNAFLNQTPIVPKDSWKCPECGRYNANYVGTCGCGTRKP